MTKKPEPPLWLSDAASLVFSRIVDRLWQRGDWRDEFGPLAEVAARACAIYASKAQADTPTDDLEEWRREARLALASIGWFPEGRGHLGVVNACGHDVDLVELSKG